MKKSFITLEPAWLVLCVHCMGSHGSFSLSSVYVFCFFFYLFANACKTFISSFLFRVPAKRLVEVSVSKVMAII